MHGDRKLQAQTKKTKKPFYHAVAFISDIHSNLAALDAVLADIKRHNVNSIYCLGDLVGYGAQPKEVVQRLVQLKQKGKLLELVCGNHDYSVCTGDTTGFSYSAKISNEWTAEQLEGSEEMAFLQQLLVDDKVKDVGRFRLVHSTWNPPAENWEYLQARNAQQNFLERKITFVGHSHVPAIFSKYSSGKNWYPIELFSNEGFFFNPAPKDISLPAGKGATQYRLKIPDSFPTMIVNVGSVGQPRDGSRYARYVLHITVDFNHYLEFRQVSYDVQDAVKCLWQRGLDCDEQLATRLCTGGLDRFTEDTDPPEWFPDFYSKAVSKQRVLSNQDLAKPSPGSDHEQPPESAQFVMPDDELPASSAEPMSEHEQSIAPKKRQVSSRFSHFFYRQAWKRLKYRSIKPNSRTLNFEKLNIKRS